MNGSPLQSIPHHYGDIIMGMMASRITSLTIVYSTVYSGADQRKHQSSASLAFLRGIHRRPVNSLHKWPVTRKMFTFDDVIMILYWWSYVSLISRKNNASFCEGHTWQCSTILILGHFPPLLLYKPTLDLRIPLNCVPLQNSVNMRWYIGYLEME